MKAFSIALMAFMVLKAAILVAYAYLLKVYPDASVNYGVLVYLMTLGLLTFLFSFYVGRKMSVQLSMIQCVIIFLMMICIPNVMGKLYWNVLYWKFTNFSWLTDINGVSIVITLQSITMLSVFAFVKPVRISRPIG